MTPNSDKRQPARAARHYFGLGLAWRLRSWWLRLAARIASARNAAWASGFRAWRRFHPPPVAESVLVWCQQVAHLPYEILLTPAPIKRSPPHTVEPQVHERHLQKLVHIPAIKYLTCVPKARLTGHAGWLVLPSGQFALELAYGSLSHLRADPGYSDPRPPRKVWQPGSYFSLMILWAGGTGGYYHWIHDVLLRLYAVLPRLPADVRFVIPADISAYQLESLRALNIKPDRLVPYTGDEEWIIEKLYFSPPCPITGHDLPEPDHWLRDCLRAAYGVTQPQPSRRIFISRRASRGRRITNEAEVEAFLHPLGFETFTLENLSFGEQVALFADAEIVVGSHGAGLANILFANEGLHVVEIFEPSFVTPCYYTMSDALNFRYSYFLGQTVGGPAGLANIAVPMNKLVATLATHGYG